MDDHVPAPSFRDRLIWAGGVALLLALFAAWHDFGSGGEMWPPRT